MDYTRMHRRVQYVVLLLLALCLGQLTAAAKILIYPLSYCKNSHLLNMEQMAQILAGEGKHHVHMVIDSRLYLERKQRYEQLATQGINIIQYPAPSNTKILCYYESIDQMLNISLKDRYDIVLNSMYRYCDSFLGQREILRRLKQENYHLALVDSVEPCGHVLVDYLKVPYIVYASVGLNTAGLEVPRPYAYVPCQFTLFSDKMTLKERLLNTISQFVYHVGIWLTNGNIYKLAIKHGLLEEIPSVYAMDRAPLVWVNSHFALDFPQPLMPNMVLIGGCSITPPKPLSDELREFVEGAQHGIIILSFGSLIKKYETRWVQFFGSVLSRFEQRVIWKLSKKDVIPENFKKNIKTVSWLPQADLLNHTNTKLFITHSGLNSALEAIYFGVPVIAMPIFDDQLHQATKLQTHANIGKVLHLRQAAPEELYALIKEVLSNPDYRQNAKRLSAIMHDEPLTPKQKMLYWVNHMTKHGVSYLKSTTLELSWYQYLLLDVVAIIITIIATVIISFIFVCRKCVRIVRYYKISRAKLKPE